LAGTVGGGFVGGAGLLGGEVGGTAVLVGGTAVAVSVFVGSGGGVSVGGRLVVVGTGVAVAGGGKGVLVGGTMIGVQVGKVWAIATAETVSCTDASSTSCAPSGVSDRQAVNIKDISNNNAKRFTRLPGK
jgi:hypothetical protein